jgi:hypothetical protein
MNSLNFVSLINWSIMREQLSLAYRSWRHQTRLLQARIFQGVIRANWSKSAHAISHNRPTYTRSLYNQHGLLIETEIQALMKQHQKALTWHLYLSALSTGLHAPMASQYNWVIRASAIKQPVDVDGRKQQSYNEALDILNSKAHAFNKFTYNKQFNGQC